MELEENMIIEAFVHFRFDIVAITSSGMPLAWPVPKFIDPRFRENKPKTLVFT